jgi:putative membrane protein
VERGQRAAQRRPTVSPGYAREDGGGVLLWSGTVFYPRYAAGEREWHVSPPADQSVAGAVMMIEGSLVTIGLFCWLFMRAAQQSDERQALLELAAARGIELSEERAVRAVAAGHGDTLRRRLLEH